MVEAPRPRLGAGQGTFTPQAPPGGPPSVPPGAPLPAPTRPDQPAERVIAWIGLAAAVLPVLLVLFTRPADEGPFILAVVAGAFTALILGIIGVRNAGRNHWTQGRVVALIALVLGALILAGIIVAAIILFLVIMAIIAACANACGGSGAASASLATGTLLPAGRPGPRRIDPWSHHPPCDHYAADTLRLRRRRLCLGCTTTLAVLLPVTGLLLLWPPPLGWWTLGTLGGALLMTQWASLAGWTRTRGRKITVKAAVGAGLAVLATAATQSPWGAPGTLLLTGLLVAAILLAGPLRAARLRRACTQAHGTPHPTTA